MKTDFKIKEAEMSWLQPQKEPDAGKRWSYSFVYYLEDLRNIYRVYDNYRIDSISTLYQKCKETSLKSWSGKEWSQRNLLEIVNALKNYRLLFGEDNVVKTKGLFDETTPESPLTESERSIFSEIYRDYFRFVEFHQLFRNGSTPIIYYMDGGRFVNRFIVSTEPELSIVGIEEKHADTMRFWDVFLKWGIALNYLKKYSLKPFGIGTIPKVKGLSIVYFYKEIPDDFSVFDFILSEMRGSYFYIPDVVFSIIQTHCYPVEKILERIIDESIARSDVFRAQSTSAIFVDEKENFLLPKIGNAYITHLLKL